MFYNDFWLVFARAVTHTRPYRHIWAMHVRRRPRVHARARLRVPARARGSFAITCHYSAWLLQLQPRAMFATRLPFATRLSLPYARLYPAALRLALLLFLPFLPAPGLSFSPFPPPRSSLTLAASNYSLHKGEPAPVAPHKRVSNVLLDGDQGIGEMPRG